MDAPQVTRKRWKAVKLEHSGDDVHLRQWRSFERARGDTTLPRCSYRRASWSEVIPDLGMLWLAPLGPPRSGSILVLRLKTQWVQVVVQVVSTYNIQAGGLLAGSSLSLHSRSESTIAISSLQCHTLPKEFHKRVMA